MNLYPYFEAPNIYAGTDPAIFLAGGISGTPDWQREATERLRGTAVVLNPRQANFPIENPLAARDQIKWEFEHLAKAAVVLFWFPDSGNVVQPIALFELGAYAYAGLHNKGIAVGAHPDYVRRQDVVMQLELARPRLWIYDSLDEVMGATERLIRKL
jgi:hypothetical protein